MDDQELLAVAFREMEKQSLHPSPEEIAQTIDQIGTDFARSEVRAHLAWCSQCSRIAAEFNDFVTPAPTSDGASVDRAWSSMRRRMPNPNRGLSRHWLAFAAGIAFSALAGVSWLALRSVPSPVLVESKQPAPRPPEPLLAASTHIVELLPKDWRTRSGSNPPDVILPTPTPRVVTAILSGSTIAGDETDVTISSAGRRIWSGTLKRQALGFSIAIAEDTLRSRPLDISIADRQGHVTEYFLH